MSEFGPISEVAERPINVRLTRDCVAQLGRSGLQAFMSSSRPLVWALPLFAAVSVRRCLREASNSQRWRRAADKLGQPPQVLRSCCQ